MVNYGNVAVIINYIIGELVLSCLKKSHKIPQINSNQIGS